MAAAAVPVPVPVPVPAEAAPAADPAAKMSNIFEGYQAGSVDDMFAPAYIKGFEPSTKALAAWTAANRPGAGLIEQTRMPNLYVDPASNPIIGADGVYGSGVPQKQMYGEGRGIVDPEALRVAAQGGRYDLEGRRAAIAARLAENERLQAPKALAPPTDVTTQRDPMEMYKWPYAGGTP
jgi:hypothetical protein